MRRSDLVAVLAALVGESCTLEDVADGWPSLGTIRTEEGDVPVALFVGPVGLSHRQRDDVERRFQNPAASEAEESEFGWKGRPLVVPGDRLPLLIGLWHEDSYVEVSHPVVVVADATKREGLTSRHSVFVRLAALVEARDSGWAHSLGSDGEEMRCLRPALLPAAVTAMHLELPLPANEVARSAAAAGLSDAQTESEVAAASERARRSISAIVRDQRFARDVRTAYGAECALCGLDLGLVQAAHIYPASAPESPDEVANGLCLCGNHHDAFDRHMIWVDPDTTDVRLHPDILSQVGLNEAVDRFVDSTPPRLRPPADEESRPDASMFRRRYDFFDPLYGWASES